MIKIANSSKRRREIERFMDPTGRFKKLRKLWEAHCALRSQIEKLEKERSAIEKQLLECDPSFFDVKHNLLGISFPYLSKVQKARISKPGIAFRNAIILQSKNVKEVCENLDPIKMPVPKSWRRDFPEIKTWRDAYLHPKCKPLLKKLISDVRSRTRLP